MELDYSRLSTGYHYVRAVGAHHLFAQWPVGRACEAEDVSGIPWSISCAEFAEQAQRAADNSQASGGSEHG
jgi:hypothetical protein